MRSVCFATSNPEKLYVAQTVCKSAGIVLERARLDIDEIQAEDPVLIVQDKSRRAYAQLGKPVVVSDDSWDIPALNGFPGPYMKSINHWFKPEDLLRLMHGVKDRTIILCQYLAYTDGKMVKVVTNRIMGQITLEARGRNDRSPSMSVIVLDLDGDRTLAEVFASNATDLDARYWQYPDVWHGFVEWYKKASH